ncbi:MAG TPA: hypothetical protein VIK77_07680 [Tissierellaceae bacterium]
MSHQIPDRINIDKNDRELYNKLSKEIFEGKTRKEQFLFAMAIGFKNGIMRPLKTKEGFFLIKDLRPEDEALLNAVAMFVKGPEILSSKEEVFKIAEEYAHAGIKILIDEIEASSFGSFAKKFERDLFELFEKLGLGGEYDQKNSLS